MKSTSIFFALLLATFGLFGQQMYVQQFTITNGLPSNQINDIQQDKIGYLWIATNKGLVKFDGDDFLTVNKFNNFKVEITEAAVLSGLEKGLFNNKSKDLLSSKKVLSIYNHENQLMVGTNEGIYKLTNNELLPLSINNSIDFAEINDILFSNDYFYIASNKGLWRLNSTLDPKSILKLDDRNFVSLEKLSTKQIIAAYNKGLLVLENKNIVKNVFTLEKITNIKKIKTELWVTSNENGIEVLALPSFSFKRKINKYNYLNTNTIHTVFSDNNQNIWIATNQGLYKYIISSSKPVKKPKIYFETILINNKNADSLLLKNKMNILSSSENNITVRFKSVDLERPNKVMYRYKLNNSFSEWTANNTIQFASLKSGNYQLDIQSKVENEFSAIASFAFKIDLPFYKQTWFFFSLIIGFLGLSYTILHFYIQNIRKINTEKLEKLNREKHLLLLEHKALQLQMNPHFIFNVLNGIKALGNSDYKDKMNKTISNFSSLLRSVLQNSRTNEITLLDEINSLKNYLELEKQMSSTEFEYKIDLKLNNIDAEEILIPTMLIQPFVENCIKHAFVNKRKGLITISFQVKNFSLYFSIKDNGLGYKQSIKKKKTSHHNSLAVKISKERISNISIKNEFKMMEISNENNITGTEVSFKIPLKTDF